MTTARDIVESAWRRITVNSSEEVPTAAEADDLLEILNDYLFSLKTRGCSYVHVKLALGDTVPIHEDLDGSFKLVLARRGAEAFGRPVSAVLERDSDMANNLIVGTLMTPFDMTVEHGLPGLSGEPNYNIETG